MAPILKSQPFLLPFVYRVGSQKRVGFLLWFYYMLYPFSHVSYSLNVIFMDETKKSFLGGYSNCRMGQNPFPDTFRFIAAHFSIRMAVIKNAMMVMGMMERRKRNVIAVPDHALQV